MNGQTHRPILGWMDGGMDGEDYSDGWEEMQ